MIHAMMAARARVLAAPGVDGLRPLVADAQRILPAAAAALAPRDAGALYGGILAASQLRDHALARNLIAKLRPAAVGNPALADRVEWLALEVALAAGNSAGMPRLTNTVSRAPMKLPMTRPRPPRIEAPPMITAAMTISSALRPA